MTNDELSVVKKAAALLDNKNAIDLVILNVENLTILTRYFVIASGASTTQIGALADEIKEKMSDEIVRVEGKENSGWIIIDLGGVIVHIFSRQMRDFYALEHLWEGALKLDLKSLMGEGEEK